ncbi:MAG TPA: hypothetical protein VF928_05580 [Usitatibacteraceae bacterium]
MNKKEKERWYLDRFLGLLPSFQPGEVVAHEGPDFLVGGERSSVGVELTELHRSVPDGVTPGQAQEAMRERVVGRAKELFSAASAAPLYVSVLLNESISIGKSDVEPLAKKIAALLLSNCPAVGKRYEGRYDWVNRDRVPKQVHRLAAYNVPNSNRAFFYAPGATWVASLTSEVVQRVLDSKEPKIPAYRSQCVETWLVIAHDTNRMSTWFELSYEPSNVEFVSSFDRVFLLNLFANKLEELNVSPPDV